MGYRERINHKNFNTHFLFCKPNKFFKNYFTRRVYANQISHSFTLHHTIRFYFAESWLKHLFLHTSKLFLAYGKHGSFVWHASKSFIFFRRSMHICGAFPLSHQASDQQLCLLPDLSSWIQPQEKYKGCTPSTRSVFQSNVIYNSKQTKKIEFFSLYSLDFEKEIRKDGLKSITIITSTSIFTNSTPVYLAAKSSSFGSRNLHGSHHLAVNSITSYTWTWKLDILNDILKLNLVNW